MAHPTRPLKRSGPTEDHHLVYEHRCKNRKIVPGGVSIMTDFELTMAISRYPDVISVTKNLVRGQISFDLYKCDLVPAREGSVASSLTVLESEGDDDTTASTCRDGEDGKEVEKKGWENGKAPGEGEEVPWRVFLGHEWKGHEFDRIVIVTIDPVVDVKGEKDV